MEKIKNLIPYLPDKDIGLGNKFLESRDFDSLYELVDSAIKRTIKHKDESIDLESLNSLKAEVSVYKTHMDGWFLDGVYTGFEDNNIIEEFY